MKKFAGDNPYEHQTGFISHQDTVCSVDCECGGYIPVVSSREIIYCGKCGRGYRTEFVVWQYDADEE